MSQRLVVLGGGESGVGAAILGLKKGYEVFLSDAGALSDKYRDVLLHHEILFEEGKHTSHNILNADIVVKSPGIPDHVALVVALKEKGIPVISEIEWGARFYEGTLVAITGSNGKTTTTLLTHHLIQKSGREVILGGNIGDSFALQVAQEDVPDLAILEVSSFQLDGIETFKPHIAILLNITPDHLDRYDYKMENYVHSKFRITENQNESDYLIYNQDDPEITSYLKQHPTQAQLLPFSLTEKPEGEGAWIENKEIIINNTNSEITMSIQKLALQGKHNIYNSMAAGVAGKILELRKEIIRESLSDFQNVEHRLEYVTSVCGVRYINDSKATNINSTWYALESMDAPTVWIVGGVDKGNDYSMLDELVADKVKAIVCLGEDNRKIHNAFAGIVDHIVDASSMHEAVMMAYKISEKGNSVLLSPACASFDLFENYEERGRLFKEAVRGL
ncbi:UDP-N-acetylmuramoyl-L-alanine--D-glutamate ligase [bacterium SCSIO 12741]|nr:UDP-N-acetylmuramoyl-L-alanine--D-glutamate ligase [bacterium SCSIO 12741]